MPRSVPERDPSVHTTHWDDSGTVRANGPQKIEEEEKCNDELLREKPCFGVVRRFNSWTTAYFSCSTMAAYVRSLRILATSRVHKVTPGLVVPKKREKEAAANRASLRRGQRIDHQDALNMRNQTMAAKLWKTERQWLLDDGSGKNHF